MERQQKTLAQQIENVLARPFKILVQEPMLIASTAYMSVCPSIISPGLEADLVLVRIRLFVPSL